MRPPPTGKRISILRLYIAFIFEVFVLVLGSGLAVRVCEPPVFSSFTWKRKRLRCAGGPPAGGGKGTHVLSPISVATIMATLFANAFQKSVAGSSSVPGAGASS